jgi:predicted ATPase
MAYLPILDILRSYFEIKEGDREFLIKKKTEEKILGLDEKFKGALPPFHELLSLTVEDEAYVKLAPKERREKTFEAVRDLLVRESQDKPVILVVEDHHWIDKTSEEFVDYLIGWLANARILLILLYRPEYTHPWGSKSYYTQIGLDQLSTRPGSTLNKDKCGAGTVYSGKGRSRARAQGTHPDESRREPSFYGGVHPHATGKWFHPEEG